MCSDKCASTLQQREASDGATKELACCKLNISVQYSKVTQLHCQSTHVTPLWTAPLMLLLLSLLPVNVLFLLLCVPTLWFYTTIAESMRLDVDETILKHCLCVRNQKSLFLRYICIHVDEAWSSLLPCGDDFITIRQSQCEPVGFRWVLEGSRGVNLHFQGTSICLKSRVLQSSCPLQTYSCPAELRSSGTTNTTHTKC